METFLGMLILMFPVAVFMVVSYFSPLTGVIGVVVHIASTLGISFVAFMTATWCYAWWDDLKYPRENRDLRDKFGRGDRLEIRIKKSFFRRNYGKRFTILVWMLDRRSYKFVVRWKMSVRALAEDSWQRDRPHERLNALMEFCERTIYQEFDPYSARALTTAEPQLLNWRGKAVKREEKDWAESWAKKVRRIMFDVVEKKPPPDEAKPEDK